MYDVEKIRADFPILSREVNGKPLVYLDNGASAQKPQVVIDAVTRAYAEEYANVHRGLHYLSNLATDKYEAVRGKVARFLGARQRTRSFSIRAPPRASTWSPMAGPCRGCRRATRSSLSVMEHHANIVPWHFPARADGGQVGLDRYRCQRRFGSPSGAGRGDRPDSADCGDASIQRAGHSG